MERQDPKALTEPLEIVDIGQILTETFQNPDGHWTQCIIIDTQRFRIMGGL